MRPPAREPPRSSLVSSLSPEGDSGAKVLMIASNSVEAVTGFSRKLTAPASWAFTRSPSPPPEALRTSTGGTFLTIPPFAIRRVASMPSIPGIFQSISTRPNGSSLSDRTHRFHCLLPRAHHLHAKAQGLEHVPHDLPRHGIVVHHQDVHSFEHSRGETARSGFS